MKRQVSIIMYHYVRALRRSRYPEIKGLSIEQFEGQIGYIKKHYTVISADDLMDVVITGSDLPNNALMLSFDDAYIDHFNYVFPILDREGIPGCFFPSAKCILERRVLGVNKIHFTLASVEDKNRLIQEIIGWLDEYRREYGLESFNTYWDKIAKPSRWDPAEVIFIKRMLQRELPEAVRRIITDALFKKYVSEDEEAFAEELYMSVDQITCLGRNGMYVGSHGFDHYWLDRLSPKEQQKEIELSIQFLTRIGADTSRWMMCYPNGSYDENLLGFLSKRGCIVGLTTEVGIADLNIHNALTLPRLNTNDLPKDAAAPTNEWTQKGIG